MLAVIFRGVFLISILTWYSTNVWKMIDGYFRDQFRSYLEEEYRKNPRLKSEVHTDTVDDIAPVSTTPRPETTVAPPREIPGDLEVELAVEVAENDSASIEANEKEEVTGGSSENEAAVGSTDKNAFLGTVESGLESRKSPDSLESRQPISHQDHDPEESRDDHRSSLHGAPSRRPRKRMIKPDKKSTVAKDSSGNARRRIKTITLTEKDFTSTRKSEVSNDDFWEFEEDADEREPLEGILVSELPFKPSLDIGVLERITAEEYCPLTLEDEASCGETTKWP